MVHLAAIAVALLPVALGSSLPNAGDLQGVKEDVSQSLASWTELGCYEDGPKRIFTGDNSRSGSMTKRVCKNLCDEYPYYGLQNGNECWCGEYDSDLSRYGTSSNCNKGCSGNSGVNCGGGYAMRTFLQSKTDKDSIGCYADSRDRIFDSKITSSNMSPAVCDSHCSSLGKKYFGTQWGEECWCGDASDDFTKNGSGTCNRPCSGDPTVFCGGGFGMTVYETTGGSSGGACYADDISNRVGFYMTKSNKMTGKFCADYCDSFDASWAMTQNGEECFCGFSNTDIDENGAATNCNVPCAGDSSETCGGRGSFNAIKLDGSAREPTGSGPSPNPTPSQPVPAPTPVRTIPTECTGTKSEMRWASGTGNRGRLYLEDGGCATMTDLYKFRTEKDGWTPKGPIYILDDDNNVLMNPTAYTGKWLLTSELFVLRGSRFYCIGTSRGGDCDELRIQSTGSTDWHEVRGHGGSLYFEKTKVTSWDTPNKREQTKYEGGRSFLNCVSEYESDETCLGQPKNNFGWCRMDIIDSTMGNMGYFDSESYGLTWKVRGFCADKSNPEVFDNVDVYGDIKNSDIYGMYYGMYSYGHQGGVWTNNKMHDNHQYGFDPHDDSDYLTIANNEVYNNVNHGIIASKRCNNVKIYNNEVYDGGAQAAGIFLHRSTDSCEVYDNDVHDMQDAGLAILESFDADIHDNSFKNVKYGIRISLGGSNNQVYDNVFDNCSKYGLYTYMGSDAPEIGDLDGRPNGNHFYNNQITNTETGVKIKEGDNIEINGNLFTGTSLLEFNDAKGTLWYDNTYSKTAKDFCWENNAGSTFARSNGLPTQCD